MGPRWCGVHSTKETGKTSISNFPPPPPFFILHSSFFMRLVIATHNPHKTGEFRTLLGPSWLVEDLSAHPHLSPPEENGSTFEENATIKTLEASTALGSDVLIVADDSGLEVDALDGRPGIHSARYAGLGAGDRGNLDKVLAELASAGIRGKARSARFRCVLVLARGGNKLAVFQGAVEGVLANEPKGSGGFGYDSAFIPDGHCQTFGQLPPEVKNSLSHRARALAGLMEHLAGLTSVD
jgi:XTP/dITP diphosphohydrolase